MDKEQANRAGKSRGGVDPVCGMQVGAESAYFVEECNQRIVFCSSHCKDKYLAAAPKDVDPVCGMRVPSGSPYTLEEGGRTLRFCSVDCRAVYQARRRQ